MIELKTNALKYKKPDGSLEEIGVVVNGQKVDDTLSKTSANPIQNKVVTEEFERLFDEKADKAYIIALFEQLKVLILAGDVSGAVAILDQAILDIAVLA